MAPLLALLGCPQSSITPNPPIRLGVVVPLTGPQAAYGVATRSGVDLAVRQVNRAGGVLGRKVHVTVIDDQSDRDQAAAATKRLIAKEQVHVLIGEISSSASLAMAPLAQRARIPMISPSATIPELTRHGAFVFRVCFADPFQAQAMARFAVRSEGLRRLAVLRDLGSAYSIALADAFAKQAQKLGAQVVMVGDYTADDSEFAPVLDELRASEAEVVYLPGYVEDVRRILLEAHEMKADLRFLGGDGWDAEGIVRLGAAADGHQFASHFSLEAPGDLVAPFVKAYETDFNEAPDAYAALGYDAANLAIDAIRRGKTTEREVLQRTLRTTKGFEGVTGRIDFTETGDPMKAAVILKIEDGRRRFVRTVAPGDD